MYKFLTTIYWDKEPYKAPIFYARDREELTTQIKKYMQENFTKSALKHLTIRVEHMRKEAV